MKPYFVYFIAADACDSVKIGVAVDMENRLMNIQNGSPVILHTIAFVKLDGMKEAYRLEKELHLRFVESHLHGEWFKFTKDIHDWIHKNAKRTEIMGTIEAHDYLRSSFENPKLRERASQEIMKLIKARPGMKLTGLYTHLNRYPMIIDVCLEQLEEDGKIFRFNGKFYDYNQGSEVARMNGVQRRALTEFESKYEMDRWKQDTSDPGFRKLLKLVLKSRGISIAKFSKMCNRTPSTVSSVLSGRHGHHMPKAIWYPATKLIDEYINEESEKERLNAMNPPNPLLAEFKTWKESWRKEQTA